MSTIYDVSKEAGVSIATVSRVLNNHPKVDPLLRQRVVSAVQALQYVPSGAARSLATGRTRRVALIIPDITNPFFPELAKGAQDTLDIHGYHLILSNTDDQQDRELRYLQMLSETGIDGLILSPATVLPLKTTSRARDKNASSALMQALQKLNVPVVGVSPEPLSEWADQVTVDEVEAARSAVLHLLNLGHRRIALIGGPEHITVTRDRQQGYRQALAEEQVALDPTLIRYANFRREGGREAMESLLTQGSPPTAVLALNDMMALGALAAIHAANLAVPEDIAVAGIDNIAEAADANPPLTSVSVPRKYEYGRIAAQLLLDRFADPEGVRFAATRKVRISTHLIVRGSTVPGISGGP